MRRPQLHEGAVTYFACFARFEYALKRTDCALIGKDTDEVSIDWEQFANRDETKTATRQLKKDESIRYFLQHPPMKRVSDAAGGWREVSTIRSSAELCGALRRMRNNLFHGDKGHPFSDRDVKLLRAGTHILDKLLEANEDVKAAYEHALEIA